MTEQVLSDGSRPAPKVGLIIVGDEILSGKRQDKHLGKVIELLDERGLKLSWAHYQGDDREGLTITLKRSFADARVTRSIVFCCGGIGGTPDDHTRQAAAAALGLEIERHPAAVELIAERCRETDQPLNEGRLRMADFPRGANLIPNPYNKIAGFAIEHHWFVPGFPVMAHPMIEWVLDTHYADCFFSESTIEYAFRIFEAAEGNLTPLMEAVELAYPGVKVFSLPSVGGHGLRRHIELGVKAPKRIVLDGQAPSNVSGDDPVSAAYRMLLEGASSVSTDIEELSPPRAATQS